MYAVDKAAKQFKVYMLRKDIIFRTDHMALVLLFQLD